ncbi:MAG: enoyl-CoA hydratase, partial [Solirubrobacteraceae bacterium]
LARAGERAREIADSPPAALAMTKELLLRAGDLPYGAALQAAREVNLRMRRSADARAGAQAFLEENRHA